MVRPQRALIAAGLAGVGVLLGRPAAAPGIIVFGTQGNNYQDTTPVPQTINNVSIGAYEGTFGSFAGTPISSQYLVTANHIGRATSFSYANGTGTTTTYPIQFVGNQDDLAVYRIDPSSALTFSLYAPLYTGTGPVGQSMVVLGEGTTRGAAVTGGWAWGAGTNRLTWGTNTVDGVLTAGQNGFTPPAGDFGGQYVRFTFNPDGDPATSTSNEAIISGGDSGGGLFVYDPATGRYELDGVNSLVDTVQDSSGNQVSAALYDAKGYYTTDPTTGQLEQITTDGPLSSYATDVESRLGFVDAETGLSYVAAPEPTSAVLAGGAGLGLFARRRRRR